MQSCNDGGDSELVFIGEKSQEFRGDVNPRNRGQRAPAGDRVHFEDIGSPIAARQQVDAADGSADSTGSLEGDSLLGSRGSYALGPAALRNIGPPVAVRVPAHGRQNAIPKHEQTQVPTFVWNVLLHV